MITQTKETYKIMVDSKELARLLSLSVSYIQKNRTRIIGAQKFGWVWRFDIQKIRELLSRGLPILMPEGRRWTYAHKRRI